MSEKGEPRVAIVTGAGSGVGACVAKQLVEQGWRVVLAARTKEQLDRCAEESGNPSACLVVPTDHTDPAQCEALIEKTMDAFGRIDALINNAGMASLVPIQDVDLEALRESFAVNTFGPGMLIAKAFPIMRKQKEGRIVNVASKGISDPFPGFFAYGAAKSAVDSFTRSIENEGKRHGVRGFTVAPGAIETGMLRGMWNEKQLPPDKTLDPAEVARTIVACATGQRDDDAGEAIFMTPS